MATHAKKTDPPGKGAAQQQKVEDVTMAPNAKTETSRTISKVTMLEKVGNEERERSRSVAEKSDPNRATYTKRSENESWIESDAKENEPDDSVTPQSEIDRTSGWMPVKRQSKIRYPARNLGRKTPQTDLVETQKPKNADDGARTEDEQNRNHFSELAETKRQKEGVQECEGESMNVDSTEPIKRNVDESEPARPRKRGTALTETAETREGNLEKQNANHQLKASPETNVLVAPAQRTEINSKNDRKNTNAIAATEGFSTSQDQKDKSTGKTAMPKIKAKRGLKMKSPYKRKGTSSKKASLSKEPSKIECPSEGQKPTKIGPTTSRAAQVEMPRSPDTPITPEPKAPQTSLQRQSQQEFAVAHTRENKKAQPTPTGKKISFGAETKKPYYGPIRKPKKATPESIARHYESQLDTNVSSDKHHPPPAQVRRPREQIEEHISVYTHKMRVEIRNNNNTNMNDLRHLFTLVKRIDPSAALLPWKNNSDNPIEELCNIPHYDDELTTFFDKAPQRSKFQTYNVAFRLEKPWGVITRANNGIIWEYLKKKLLFIRMLTGPSSQPLVAVGFMAYSHPEYTHRISLKKDLARRMKVNENDIYIRARTVGADAAESAVVTRALIIEAPAHKSKGIKTACMENLGPDTKNRISGNQVFVPFGNIDGFNNRNREKWIKRQTSFLKQVSATPVQAFSQAKEAFEKGTSDKNPRSFFLRKTKANKRLIWSIEEMGTTTLIISKTENKREVENAIAEWNSSLSEELQIYKRASGPPLSTAAKTYAQALSESSEFDPFDFPELSPTAGSPPEAITRAPTQSPTVVIRHPATPPRIPNAPNAPMPNAVTPTQPENSLCKTNELEILNRKMDADFKEWRASTKNIEDRQNAFQTQVNTSVKNLHLMITNQQQAFTKMQNQINVVLDTQKTTMCLIGEIHRSIKEITTKQVSQSPETVIMTEVQTE